jgi:hypothetical protein
MTDKKHTEHHQGVQKHKQVEVVPQELPLSLSQLNHGDLMALSFYRQQDGKHSVQVMDEYYQLKDKDQLSPLASSTMAETVEINSETEPEVPLASDSNSKVSIPASASIEMKKGANEESTSDIQSDLNSLIKELAIEKEQYQEINQRLDTTIGMTMLTVVVGFVSLVITFQVNETMAARILAASVLPIIIGSLWSGFSNWGRAEGIHRIAKEKVEKLSEKIAQDGKSVILFNEKVLKITENMSEAQKAEYFNTYESIHSIDQPEIIYDLIGQSRLRVNDFLAEDIKEYFQTLKQIQTVKENFQLSSSVGFIAYLTLVWIGMAGMDLFSNQHFGFFSFIGMGALASLVSVVMHKVRLKKHKPLQVLNEKLQQAKKNLKKLNQYFPGKKIDTHGETVKE